MVYYFGTTKQYGTPQTTYICISKLEMENSTGKIIMSQLRNKAL